jgi:hypothetical protein
MEEFVLYVALALMPIGIGCLIGLVIINYKNRVRKSKTKHSSSDVGYDEAVEYARKYICHELNADEAVPIARQSITDSTIKEGIRRESQRLFNEWLMVDEVEYDGKKFKPHMIVIHPFVHGYLIDHEETAKYKEPGIINDLVMEGYNKLKDNYNKE